MVRSASPFEEREQSEQSETCNSTLSQSSEVSHPLIF